MPDAAAARLEALLGSIPAPDLASLLGRRRFQPLHRLVTGEGPDRFADALIARYAVALDGVRLLEKPGVLSELLIALGHPTITAMARRHLDQPFSQDADNALALSSRPLRAGSALTRDVFAALGLGEALLQEDEKRSAVELIDPYEPLPPLLSFQSEVRERCAQLLAKGSRELLVQMPTGSGKTRTAMELVVDFVAGRGLFLKGLSVVWLAHTEELCEQAIDAFSSVWATRGAERCRIVRLWGSYAPPQSALIGAFVVAGTSRIHAMRASDTAGFGALADRTALVVIDEAHRALAPTVVSQISALRSSEGAVLIGLSATPARTSEASDANDHLARLFSHNLVTPDLGNDPIAELRRRGILAELERVELRYAGSEDAVDEALGGAIRDGDDDEDLPEGVLLALAGNTNRNSAIIEELERRASRVEPAIVFCCSVAHAHLLAAALRLRGLQAASVDCQMRRGTRRLVIQQFARGQLDVLLNFGVLSTGFDAPNVRTVVIARPTRSMILYSQMLGRGLRGPKMGGTAACTLIDVRDHLGRFGELSALYLRFKPYWESEGNS